MSGVVPGRARALALTLTARGSRNGTAEETAFGPFLFGLLARLRYFRDHPEHLLLVGVPDDPLNRSFVLAIVRGRGPDTVVLTGHFDTVHTADYGDLEPLATDPVALLPKLIERLRESRSDRQALDDLQSGRFVPGRGLLDMKSGLAAGLAALEAFAERSDRQGSLVFLAVPDEENASAGMRAAAPRLKAIAQVLGLDLRLAINLDALADEGDGREGQVVALGAIGKTLLSAYVVGHETHACYPFDGISAAALAADLVSALECAPSLAEDGAPPPATLVMRDLKGAYDVTTPGRVWCCWNVISHARSAGEVLELARAEARASLGRTVRRLESQAARFGAVQNLRRAAGAGLEVMTFEELVAAFCRQRPGGRGRLQEICAGAAAAPDLDLPTRALRITDAVWREAGHRGPAVVLGFASMPYPATRTLTESEPDLLDRVAMAVEDVEARFGTRIGVKERLDVIADLSFLGSIDAGDLRRVAANTPFWGHGVTWDLCREPAPGLPAINVGPWGRGYHHWLERVEARYAFEVLPELVLAIADAALAAGAAEPGTVPEAGALQPGE